MIKRFFAEVYLSLTKRGGAKRYRRLYEVIGKDKCKKIMEIGTWNGNNATKMVEAARTNYPPHEIEYYGFDLFELMSIPKLEEEYAGDKTPLRILMSRIK